MENRRQYPKICSICGKEYLAKRERNMYCSETCKREADKLNFKKKYRESIGWNDRKCRQCGKPVADGFAYYCSHECQLKYNGRKGLARRRAREVRCKVVDSDITLMKLYERDKGICHLCGKTCNFNDKSESGRPYKDYPSIDHIKPLSLGGEHSWDNVKLACISCNCGKQNRFIG